jgi:formylmethanofuran dehydrogenase subunit E
VDKVPKGGWKMTHKNSGTLVPDEVVKGVVEFHGHLGPFLVLGLKAGLLANSLLGKDCFKTRTVVTATPSPPFSCFVDGVQFVTGCTMGKGNIKLRKGKRFSVSFLKEEKTLTLRLRKEILDYISNVSSEKVSRQASLNLLNKSADELFEIEH